MEGQVNRAIGLWESWHQKQNMLESVFGSGIAADLDKEKYNFLSSGAARISPDASADEKLVLAMLRKTTARLEKQLYPNPVMRVLRRLKSLVYDRPVQAARLKKVKAENVLVLSETLSGLGLNSDRLNLDKLLDFERANLNVPLTAPYGTNHNFNVTLHLEKDQAGQYQLQSYTAMLKDPRNPEKNRSFTFDAASSINAMQAVNLLQGRAVTKHYQIGTNRMASKWVQLDFNKLAPDGKPTLKETNANDEFNIYQEATKIAVALNKPELTDVMILNGMEQGNQIALKQLNGETSYLEANPLNKEIVILNDKQQPITLKELKKQKEVVLTPKPQQAKTHIKKLQLNKKQQQDQSLSVS